MAATLTLPASPTPTAVTGGVAPRLRGVARALFTRRTAWLWAAFVVSRVCVFAFLAGRGTDLHVHAGYALRIRHGQLPFRDFDAEYPPLALAFDAMPTLLDPTGAHYFPLFRAMMCGVDVAVWSGLLLASRGRLAGPLLYVVGSTALGPLLYDRIDLALGGILMAAAVAADRGRCATAGLATGVGIAFKLIPIVWAPVLCALAWRYARTAGLCRTAACLLAVPVLTVAPFWPRGSAGLTSMLRYHAERGVQVESVPATVEMLLINDGMSGGVVYDHGGFSLVTRISGPLVTASTIVLAASVCVFTGFGLFTVGRHAVGPLLLASLVAALAASKVLSPQYLLSVLPVLCVAGGPAGHVAGPLAWAAWAACFGLTGTVFPFLYDRLIALASLPCWLVITRNDLLVLLATVLASSVTPKFVRTRTASHLRPVGTGRGAE